ncbi:MAG TPA: hypothetical protein PK788_11675 [Gemmatimonadaceae bacterium]|nr:hypothetical protein [Gemmatimonadaceae bacterium]
MAKAMKVEVSLPITEDGEITRSPNTPQEAAMALVVLLGLYEQRQSAYRDAVDEFYAHDAKGKLIEVECIEELISGGTTKTDAGKLAKVQPKYLTWQDTQHVLAKKRDDADTALSIARRRADTMTTMAHILFGGGAPTRDWGNN